MKTSTLLWILGGTAVGAGVAYYLYSRSQQPQGPAAVNVFVKQPSLPGPPPGDGGGVAISLTPQNLLSTSGNDGGGGGSPPGGGASSGASSSSSSTGAKKLKSQLFQMADASTNRV